VLPPLKVCIPNGQWHTKARTVAALRRSAFTVSGKSFFGGGQFSLEHLPMTTDTMPPPVPVPAPAPATPRLSKLALAALILAVLGLAIPLLAPVAIVLAIVALRQTGRDPALKG
jgi:hypothetical protein